MQKHPVILFADKLPPKYGGMELHAGYFIQYFKNHPLYPLEGIITKNFLGKDHFISDKADQEISLHDIRHLTNPKIVFFNSGHWIEDLGLLASVFRKSKFIYRTGGNEIIKADLSKQIKMNHALRQQYWTDAINKYIDLLITNSNFTEKRLSDIGIHTQFFRCVGGVNVAAIPKKSSVENEDETIRMFCAARFVPYKNHNLLIKVFHELVKRGYNINLSLAGDGPLLPSIKELVKKNNLELSTNFLGVTDNTSVCEEIAKANIYIQLSSDYLTAVDEGAYIHCEGMGRSILEAISAGTFIIAGNSGALPELVFGDRGILVDIDNPKNIANKIEPFLKNPAKPPQLATYCWKKVFAQYEVIMKKVLAK